jgi:D-alanyl-D-alanine carboxypeptidase/D-alanyl-D-alanine-endopeptidase (penicillin-binding protein 4)
MFVPASNIKLLTGAAALETLGPDYRFRTTVSGGGPVRAGVLQGDLVVRGGGDPTISARFHGGDARAVFRAWADSLAARGVRRVSGRVVGIDSVFDDVPLGRGWAWDDLDAPYSAEISGLAFNEGAILVRALPDAAGGVRVTTEPPTGYAPLEAAVARGAPGAPPRLQASRALGAAQVRVRGVLPTDSAALQTGVAVRNSTGFFVAVLRETLIERGIRVDGAAVDADDLAPGDRVRAATPLFEHASPPLAEILPAYMKPSQNQIAEMLLRGVGRERRGAGSVAAGAAVMDSLLGVWGVEPRRLVMADGSGLSRYNLASPSLFVGLLARMGRGPHAALWRDALPVAGVDGTLASRLRGTPAQGNVRAKTGTLSGTRGLSGYLTTADGEGLAFSILVNGHTLAVRVIDAALLRLVGWSRRASP